MWSFYVITETSSALHTSVYQKRNCCCHMHHINVLAVSFTLLEFGIVKAWWMIVSTSVVLSFKPGKGVTHTQLSIHVVRSDIRWSYWHSVSDPVCHWPRSVLPDDAWRSATSGVSEACIDSLHIHPGTAWSAEQNERQWRHFIGLSHRHTERDQDKN